jgi:hypothetical protein
MVLLTLLIGCVEGFYGRVRYSADAISYLDVTRAIHAGDWKLALNPLWSLGYPMLLSLLIPLFPAGPNGEWIAIHCGNLIILAVTLLSYLYLAAAAIRCVIHREIAEKARTERFLWIAAFDIFVAIEFSMDNASRVGPDMLVSCLVFAAAGVLLRFETQPSTRRAVLLGVILGLGYITKAIFLPLATAFVGIEFMVLLKRRTSVKYCLYTLTSLAVFAIPYAAGLSWAFGRLTTGEAGSLNYAWHVNKLEPEGFWQGGPAGYGTPLHPVQLVLDSPHVFLFKEPFPVSYPPFFNAPYYYEGYRHFFSLQRQARAFGANLIRLWKILHRHLIIYAVALCLLLHNRSLAEWRNYLRCSMRWWPLTLVSFYGIGIYFIVYLEGRYISSFVVLLLVVACFALVRKGRVVSPNMRMAFLWILTIGAISTFVANQRDEDRDVFGHIARHESFDNYDQWKAGIYLRQIGLAPGDDVAEIADHINSMRCTWAAMDHLRIIGQIGGEITNPQPDDLEMFWHSTPQTQQQALEVFHHAGARLVLALSKPGGFHAPGWQAVPGTDIWLYRF